MKKQLALLMFASFAFASMVDAADVVGHTFFSVRPPFQSPMPEKVSLFRDRALARDCGWGGAFQVVGFGGRSARAKDLAKYFTFCGKDELVVNSNGEITEVNRDVNPLHFNIQYDTSFSSKISFRPRQTYAGVGFQYSVFQFLLIILLE